MKDQDSKNQYVENYLRTFRFHSFLREQIALKIFKKSEIPKEVIERLAISHEQLTAWQHVTEKESDRDIIRERFEYQIEAISEFHSKDRKFLKFLENLYPVFHAAMNESAFLGPLWGAPELSFFMPHYRTDKIVLDDFLYKIYSSELPPWTRVDHYFKKCLYVPSLIQVLTEICNKKRILVYDVQSEGRESLAMQYAFLSNFRFIYIENQILYQIKLLKRFRHDFFYESK